MEITTKNHSFKSTPAGVANGPGLKKKRTLQRKKTKGKDESESDEEKGEEQRGRAYFTCKCRVCED